MPVYIERINGDVDRPTNQPTNRANIEQSAFSKVRQKKKGRDLQKCPLNQSKYQHMIEGIITLQVALLLNCCT